MQLSPEQLAATAIDDNLVVNAGAGSGKTTVLTRRYVRLLEEGGLTPEQIVAITFTARRPGRCGKDNHSLAAKAAGGRKGGSAWTSWSQRPSAPFTPSTPGSSALFRGSRHRARFPCAG